ncbi:virulence factor [Phaeovulum vinaykumarii]|uniref:Virulence factor n=1 Tax=Phaeovulum vinaykumarii TaxID=407234 RepID=A0A1N7M373_9RHOB|nr:virulence factor [Phaeovulum vinaykumarii]SIS80493.1 Virulence factor [Phaeovulum vinaykumarii]SOC09186.1 cvfA/B/C family virulence factor [Phaeovulum vinaykumarii]
MARITLVFWRDMPAQVLAGSGRRATRVELSPRFAEAIDRAAMAGGARDEGAYLDGWHRLGPFEVAGTDAEATTALADRIETLCTDDWLRARIASGGTDPDAARTLLAALLPDTPAD